LAITDRPAWASDVPISMPLPAGEDVMVPMFGFGMTQYRLVHDLSRAEYEALAVPVYSPPQASGSVSRDDAGIDARTPGEGGD
jgi:hypothetical protein